MFVPKCRPSVRWQPCPDLRVFLFVANQNEEELHECMLRLRRLLLLPSQLDELLYPRMLLQPSEKVMLLASLIAFVVPGDVVKQFHSSCVLLESVCRVQHASRGTSPSTKQHVQGCRLHLGPLRHPKPGMGALLGLLFDRNGLLSEVWRFEISTRDSISSTFSWFGPLFGGQ